MNHNSGSFYLGEMARELGCSARRIQLWSDAGLFSSDTHPGSGSHREYSEHDLETARVLNLLSDLGVAIGVQVRLIDHLLKTPKDRSVLEHLRTLLTQNH